MAVLGIDVGGSSVKTVVDGGSGAAVVTTPLPADAGVPWLLDTLERLLAGREVDAAGIAVPGVVHRTGGRVVRSANVPWLEDLDLVARATERLGVPVVLMNDGEAFALAEARVGAGAGQDDVLALALGTGVAGCRVLHGRIDKGAHRAGGEYGHVVLDPAGDPCGCGQRGCVETWIGAPHLVRRWVAAGGPVGATPEQLVAAARAGDGAATAVVDAATEALGRLLLLVTTVIDPGVVVVGGGLAQSADVLIDPALRAADRASTFQRVPALVLASLGPSAGARGAALAAADAI